MFLKEITLGSFLLVKCGIFACVDYQLVKVCVCVIPVFYMYHNIPSNLKSPWILMCPLSIKGRHPKQGKISKPVAIGLLNKSINSV